MIVRTHFLLSLFFIGNINTYRAQSQSGFQKLDFNVGPCQVQILESCNDSAIKFFLYSSLGNGTQLNSTHPKIPESYIPNAPIKIIIHGWAGSLTAKFTNMVRDAYLKSPNPYNVIVVDWSALGELLCYASAIINSQQVASCISQILIAFARQDPLWDAAHLHLIGHSLGAHIAAFTSNDLLSKTGRRAARITGLDPALPGFVTMWSIAKLDPSDADFVDVIHTCAGVFGKIEPSGHADFYFNGGQLQPYCTAPGRLPGTCSHIIAVYYFAESINYPKGFWGQPCSTEIFLLLLKQSATSTTPKWWTSSTPVRCPPPSAANEPQWLEAYMGDATDVRTRGTFYVKTAANYPFALGRPANVSKLFFIAPVYVQEYEYLYFYK